MILYYILDENNNISTTTDLSKWGIKHIARNTIRVNRYRKPKRGGYRKPGKRRTGYVSTVFLGIDHNFHGVGPPLLFETMIFVDGPLNEYQERYSSLEDAKREHKRALKKLRDIHGS